MSLEDVPTVAEFSPAQAVSVAAATALDGRRRPGRSPHVSPQLVPLLRNAVDVDIPTSLPSSTEVASFNDDLSIARGFGIGMLLAIPAWAAIGLVVWALLR